MKQRKIQKLVLEFLVSQMQRFDFLFGTSLGYEVLRHTENLSKTLQHKDMSAAEGQGLAKLKLDILENLLLEKIL